VGRPRTRVGEHGEVTVRELGPKRFEADGRVRLRNGRYARIRRQGPSRTAARNRWNDRAREIADDIAGKAVSGDTLFGRVMDLWLLDFESKVERGVRAHKSLAEYRSTVNGYLRPELGELTCREAENAGLMDETLKTIRAKAGKVKGRGKNGDAAAKRARTVLSGMCGYAVRHGAMDSNPVKAAEAMDHEHEEVRALEVDERGDFLAKLRVWCDEKAGTGRVGLRGRAWTDLADMAEAMLSTGCRIGEVLALVGDGVDIEGRRVEVSHHLVRVPGVGMVRQAKRKGRRPGLRPGLPSWSLPMWRRRKLESGGGPLFPSWNGAWLDPGNVAKRLAQATEAIGYGWVSSRYFRHTTATHIVDSGLTNEDAADALGNTPDVVQKNYRRRQQENARVDAAMESLMGG
jgi:integrase